MNEIANKKIVRKLQSLNNLPSIPHLLTEVFQSLDEQNLSASDIAKLIERDQVLAGKVLKVANSSFYGFSRRISTIELAIVIMGTNTIKEIILSLFMQKFISKINPEYFDLKSFWNYSLYCACASRVLARKLGYKLVGEAFVAGLVHDIGILVIAEYFSKQYSQIKTFQLEHGLSLFEAENKILETNHCEIGYFIANKWNLPVQICNAIANHHTPIHKVDDFQSDLLATNTDLKQPLTAIVSISEWLSLNSGLRKWTDDIKLPSFYLSDEIIEDIDEYDYLSSDSTIGLLNIEIEKEFEKLSEISELISG